MIRSLAEIARPVRPLLFHPKFLQSSEERLRSESAHEVSNRIFLIPHSISPNRDISFSREFSLPLIATQLIRLDVEHYEEIEIVDIL